jgi:hypothetical protein
MAVWRKIEAWWDRADKASTVLSWLGLWKPFIAVLCAVLTIVAGHLQQTPIAYTLAAAAIVMAAIFSALNSFDQWLGRNTVDGHLVYCRLDMICHAKATYPNPSIVGYQPVVMLANTSPKPVYYKMNRMHSVIGGKANARPVFESKEGMVPAGHEHKYLYDTIADVDASNGPLQGSIEFDFSYGRSPQSLPYQLTQSRTIRLSWETPDKTKPPTLVNSVLIS